MAASNIALIRKLQTAINTKGEKLLYSTSQFYSEQQKRPVTCYHIKKAIYDEDTGRNKNIELFKAYSTIQILLFLRDYWYELNNIPLPEENATWNKIRANIKGEEDDY